jgi:hypothetical protein
MKRYRAPTYQGQFDWRRTAYLIELRVESPLMSSRNRNKYLEFFDEYPDVLYDEALEPTLHKNECIDRFWFSDVRAAMEFKIRFG